MNPEDIAAIKANVQKMLDAGASDEDVHGYIQASGLQPARQPLSGQMGHPIVDASPEQPENPNDISGAVARHVLNAAQGIPGMEAVEAAAGALGSQFTGKPMDYTDALNALRGETSKIGGKTAAAERFAGSLLTLPFLPASPALAGAAYGAADQLLNADPNENVAERGGRTVVGGVVGGLLGKAADMGVTATRSLLSADPTALFLNKSYAANLLDRQAARASAAKALYDKALAEGQGRTASGLLGPLERTDRTAPIRAYLAEPDVAATVADLQATRDFKDVAPESPEMLDAIYKSFSDRARQAKKGLDAFNPAKVNLGRYNLRNITQAQQDLIDAMSGGSSMPGPMPTYREAVKEYARHTTGEESLKKGYESVRSLLSEGIPSTRSVLKTDPEVLSRSTLKPEELQGTTEGALAAARAALLKKPLTAGRRSLSAASSVIRAANPADVGARAAKVGLLGSPLAGRAALSLLGW